MQDEVNEKTVAISIKATKLTAKLLQAALKKLLAEGKKQIDTVGVCLFMCAVF